MSYRLVAFFLVVLLCLVSPGHAQQAYIPSVKIGTAALISPSNANIFYGSGTTSTNGTGATVRPPEIVELARALRNNPDLIYEYVRNNIDVVWLYGLQKGALGTSIDKSGTAFDQAMLMVELLRQAGYTATYKAGTITLTGAQFAAWTGISDATAACQLLASGGFPGAVNGSSSATCAYGSGTPISSVELAHVWVAVTISGSTYVFDPAYKPHTWKAGINLAAATGITTGQALSQATTGATSGVSSSVSFVRNLNMTQLGSTLQTYATNLLAYLQSSNLSAASLEDVVGGGEIQNYTSPSGGLRQASLPYTASTLYSWSGGIPDQYRTTLRVFARTQNHAQAAQGNVVYDTMFDKTFFVDEIYGRSLELQTDFVQGMLTQVSSYSYNKVWLMLDQQSQGIFLIQPATATPPAVQYSARPSVVEVKLTANHPYAAAANGSATTNGAYMDATVEKAARLVTGLSIVHGWGDVSPALTAKYAEERISDYALPKYVVPAWGCENGTAPCQNTYLQPAGEFTRVKAGANWLGQMTRASKLHAAIAKSVMQHHHSVGIVYGDVNFQTYKRSISDSFVQFSVSDNFDRIDVDTAFSLTSKTADATARRGAVHAVAATIAALEGSIAAQVNDLPDTSSTATRFEWGNAPPAAEDPSGAGARKFLEFTAANASQAPNIVVAEGQTSNGVLTDMVGSTQQPILSDATVQARRNILANAITAYANAGYSIASSEEGFLGPGQRGGTIEWANGNATYTPKGTKQRGGAFVATRYAAGEPVEIAHMVLHTGGASQFAKGGGGGNTPDAGAKYDPDQAADIIKARFIDKSSVHGVTLANGKMSFDSPAVLTVGSGKFPYELSARYSFRAGMPNPQNFGPSVPSQPQSGWTSNWHNNLTVSGSGLEAMGQTDIRAAVGAIAAFAAAQDIYKASPSLPRDIAGVLTNAWWVRQLSGNVVTVALGHSTRQFVKLIDGTYQTLGAGATATLVQNGTRVPFEEKCTTTASIPQPYALTRGWNYQNLSFTVTNAGGDTQQFGYWKTYYWDGENYCGNQKGFRMTGWTFPQGPSIALTYLQNTNNSGEFGLEGGTDSINEVTNSLGRKLRYSTTSYTIDDGLTPARSITIGTDPSGNTMTWTWTSAVYLPTATARPMPYAQLARIFTPDNPTKPSIEYLYDALGRVKEVKDATALQWQTRGAYQFFIADGTRGERVDPAGGSYVVTYDTDGRPWRYTDEIGRKTEVFYDGRGRPVRYVYPELDEELLEYDARNNPTKLTKVAKPGCTVACSQEITAAWHTTWNKPLWVKDQMGRQSDFTYYETGNGKSLIATALRPSVAGTRPTYSFTYDNRGLLLTSTDPTGLVTQNSYDATNGNLLSTIVNPGGLSLTTVMAYDAVGNVTSVTDPRGNASSTTYDANRRKLVVTMPLGAASRTTYDAVGRVIKEERATGTSGGNPVWGHVTQIAYTPTGQKAQVIDADGRVTRMLYDAVDRPLVTIDPESRRVRKVYDLAGQTLQEIRGDASPLQQVYAERSYTPNGKEAWIKDAKGNQTTYGYDPFDRLERTTFPDGTYEQLSYDVMGNVVSKLTRGGQLIVNTYDTLDRMVTHLVPQPTPNPAILTTTTYDLAGRTTSISDNTGHSLTYGFDTAKRPTSVAQAAPTFTGTRVVSYVLDPNGNKTRTNWADGYYVAYQFDALNRMTTASENGTFLLATYIYDTLGRRTSLVYGNGASQGYTYTTQGDMLTLASTLTGTANTYTNTFTKAHQLASEVASNAAWSYAPATFQTTSYSAANNLNQYVTVTVGANPTVTMSYDANGNLTGDGTWTFAYDANNMLRSATKAGGSASYDYDPLGRRQRLTENGITTSFLHDGDEEIGDYAESGGTSTLLRRYVPGPGTDVPIAMITPSGGSNSRKYFHTNRQGSTIAMSADAGTMAEGPYTYDAYGNGAPATGVPFKYTGRRLDPGTGLYFFRARYYTSELGRFLQTDPVGYEDQMNLYAFVHDDPYNLEDPFGEMASQRGGNNKRIDPDARKQLETELEGLKGKSDRKSVERRNEILRILKADDKARGIRKSRVQKGGATGRKGGAPRIVPRGVGPRMLPFPIPIEAMIEEKEERDNAAEMDRICQNLPCDVVPEGEILSYSRDSAQGERPSLKNKSKNSNWSFDDEWVVGVRCDTRIDMENGSCGQ